MRYTSLMVIAALALGACEVRRAPDADAPTSTAAAAPLTQTDAEKIVADSEKAWSSGAVETVMANYAPGATVFDTSRLAATADRNLVTRGNADFLAMKPADFTVADRDTQPLGDDVIVSSGVVSFTAQVGQARPVMKARYTQVFERQPEGNWKIVHEHMSAPPPGTMLP